MDAENLGHLILRQAESATQEAPVRGVWQGATKAGLGQVLTEQGFVHGHDGGTHVTVLTSIRLDLSSIPRVTLLTRGHPSGYIAGMAITYDVSTTPDDAEWRVRGVLYVYGAQGPWCVFAVVSPQRAFDVIELRVIPIENTVVRSNPDELHGFDEAHLPTVQNSRGEWSGEPGLVPQRGGIPSRLLRSIRERDIQDAARAWMVHHGLAEGRTDPQWVRAAQAAVADERLLDELKPDQRLALVAARYVALVDAGEVRPNALLSEQFDRSPEWVAQEVYRARQRGLLEPRKPGRGQAIGRLTETARSILDDLDQEHDR
ncbi:MAG: hypothetical protein JJT89_06615 [Nitriliruptoraceae bacterium]|nr:hypothetical protein [Nitriliruptoraceae bacterium]